MTMNRETLRTHLHNPALVQIIKAKQEIDSTCKSLADAYSIMDAVDISESAIQEIKSKISEYRKISLGYGNILEDLWGITWHWEATLERYIDYEDYEIDDLPEYVKMA